MPEPSWYEHHKDAIYGLRSCVRQLNNLALLHRGIGEDVKANLLFDLEMQIRVYTDQAENAIATMILEASNKDSKAIADTFNTLLDQRNDSKMQDSEE
jgi:hypothetical protein